MVPLPREHGAYAQMATPLVTSLVVAGVSAPAGGAAAALVLGFLAHEPLLVLLGVRGPRARREAGGAAITWLGLTAAAAAVCGGLAVAACAPALRWTFALPAVPALLVLIAAVRGTEKRWTSEVLVALTFSLAAVPVCRAAGAADRTAWAVAAPFAVVFVASTLAVRGVIQSGRATVAGSAAASRIGAAVLAAAGAAALAAAAARGLLPWASAVAVAPGALAAVGLALRPPAPRHLHAVGWTLGGVTLTAALVLMIA